MTKKEEKYYVNCIMESLENKTHLWRYSIDQLIRKDGLSIWKPGGDWSFYKPRYEIESYWLNLKFNGLCNKTVYKLKTNKNIFEKYCQLSISEIRKQKLKKLK